MIDILFQIFLGIMYASLVEYVLHKYILHGQVIPFTRNFYISHFHSHHFSVRRNNFYDVRYRNSIFDWDSSGREIVGVLGLIVVHLPTWYISQIFCLSLSLYALAYLYLHRRMHLYPEWGTKYFPWHKDHHMIGSQSYAWSVVLPIWDYILNTRYYDKNPPIYKKKRK